MGISLSIPLFNRSSVRRDIGELKTEMLNQQLAQAKLLSDIWNEIEQMCLEAEIRKQNYEALREQETNYREILSLRRIQYEQGKLSVYDLLTAESNWRNVRAELLLERYNLNCYLEMLDFYKTGGRKGGVLNQVIIFIFLRKSVILRMVCLAWAVKK